MLVGNQAHGRQYHAYGTGVPVSGGGESMRQARDMVPTPLPARRHGQRSRGPSRVAVVLLLLVAVAVGLALAPRAAAGTTASRAVVVTQQVSAELIVPVHRVDLQGDSCRTSCPVLCSDASCTVPAVTTTVEPDSWRLEPVSSWQLHPHALQLAAGLAGGRRPSVSLTALSISRT